MSKENKIIKFAKKLNLEMLSPIRSGNISIRSKKENINGFLITPSGKKYDSLESQQIVFVSNQGKYKKGKEKPSSEWRFHQEIYNSRADVKSIVHCHSPYAVAVSCFAKPVPAFHYMVAIAGGDSINCAKYSTFGTKKLSINIIKALQNRLACLISNHGQVAVGKTVEKAFELAQEIEILCQQYTISLKIGLPKILTKKEMQDVLKKIKTYKK